MFGFELKGGKHHPIVGGIVVLQHDEEMISDALDQAKRILLQQSQEKKFVAVVSKWRRLASLILTNNRLKIKYKI